MRTFYKLTSLLSLLISNKIYSAGQLIDKQYGGVDDDEKPANLILPKQPSATFTINGTTYKLSTEICNGGVMFKRKNPVQFCGVGEFYVRPSGCSIDNGTLIGIRNEYTCSSFPNGAQIFLTVGNNNGDVDKVSFTATGAVGTLTSTSTEGTSEETTVISVVEPIYSSSVELKSTNDLLLEEHNNLMEEGGTAMMRNTDEFPPPPSTTPTTDEDYKDSNEENTELDLMKIELVDEKRLERSPTTTAAARLKTRAQPKIEKDGSSASAEDTLPLRLNAPNSTSDNNINSSSVNSAQRMDGHPLTFQNIDKTSKDNLAIFNSSSLPIIDSILNENVTGRRNDFQIDNDPEEDGEFSSEIDERGGPWEGDGESALPAVGTLERDVLTGGFDKWIGMVPQSPLFNSHVTLLKRQIEFELLGANAGDDESREKNSHFSVIGDKDVAYNATWYAILTEVAITASSLIPEELFRDPFSVSSGSKTLSNGTEPSNKLFADALRIFGYFTRSYEGDEIEIKGTVWEAIREGFRECREKAEVFNRGCVVGLSGIRGTNCVEGVELKSIKITQPVWNEYNATFTKVSRTLDFSSSSYDLPPISTRINPTKWIFAELMWYAVQMTHMFCFDSFSRLDPNAFMIAYNVMLRLFQSDLVVDLWDDVGGNLDVFELLLPYIRRGFAGAAGPGDFRNLLAQLDKLASGIRATGATAAIGEFGRRKRWKGKKESVWKGLTRRRRRRRDVGGGDGLVGDEDLSSRDNNMDNENAAGASLVPAHQASKVLSQTGWFRATQKSTVEVVTDVNGIDAAASSYAGGDIMETLGHHDSAVVVSAIPSTTTEQKITPTNNSPVSTAAESAVNPSYSTTSKSSLYKDASRYHEIWGGLAYCLVADEDGNQAPTFEEMQRYGICEERFL